MTIRRTLCCVLLTALLAGCGTTLGSAPSASPSASYAPRVATQTPPRSTPVPVADGTDIAPRPTRTAAPARAPSWELPSSFPTAADNADAERVRQAQRLWESQGIRDYRIALLYYENFANGLTTEREVVVRDRQVEQSTCASGKEWMDCPAFVLADVYTVDDLFAVASRFTGDCLKALVLDDTLGYPRYIAYDCEDWADEDFWVSVKSLEVLP